VFALWTIEIVHQLICGQFGMALWGIGTADFAGLGAEPPEAETGDLPTKPCGGEASIRSDYPSGDHPGQERGDVGA
jgi:hypothetical protein